LADDDVVFFWWCVYADMVGDVIVYNIILYEVVSLKEEPMYTFHNYI